MGCVKLREGFLKKFIEGEIYLQNPPMRTKDFIEFSKKRGIITNAEELEFFEKKGFLYPILRIENPRNSVGNHGYITISFQNFEKDLILSLFKNNKIFDPSKLPFQQHSTFKDKKNGYFNERISSFYSSFQVYWLEILKNRFSFSFNFASTLWNDKKIESLDDFIFELKKRDNIYYFDNFQKENELLKDRSDKFQRVLEFLLSIQEFYYPYGSSGSRAMYIKDADNWWGKKPIFDPKKELERLGTNIEEVSWYYKWFSQRSMEILGVKRDDWIQLWKNIAWRKKNELNNEVRVGIEYLQWAIMLKRFLEDYCGNNILDIDEVDNISHHDILNFDTSEENQSGRVLRSFRHRIYFDPKKNKNYYHDKYKRLFYLANAFELNYQPRIMVFVEGETEEGIFPRIFEWYYAKPENLGIEIVNFKGVDKLLSTSQNATELKNLIDNIQKDLREKCISTNQRIKMTKLIKKLKNTDIVISNWTSFIRYNLEKWQIIPFFVSDNEGNVKHFLDAGKPINFEGKNYDIPSGWKYLWGETNENKPYKGNNFEFANFSDEEIVLAINQVLNDEIDIEKVKKVREQEEGIKKIDDRILKSGTKRKIVQVLFDNLFKEYEETNGRLLLDRPIFRLIDKIMELANLNHLPTNTEIELINKNYILSLLK